MELSQVLCTDGEPSTIGDRARSRRGGDEDDGVVLSRFQRRGSGLDKQARVPPYLYLGKPWIGSVCRAQTAG